MRYEYAWKLRRKAHLAPGIRNKTIATDAQALQKLLPGRTLVYPLGGESLAFEQDEDNTTAVASTSAGNVDEVWN